MKRVAILGGGPAGAFAAGQLASAGFQVQLFDDKLAWEKPCGGGVTYKAYSRYPFLMENPAPKRIVRETVLGAPGAGEVRLNLDHALAIYSRFDLNNLLLERAGQAGAAIEKARVLEMTRHGSLWRLRTSAGAATADFCIVATGARHSLREAGTGLGPRDAMAAMGYYVPGDQTRIDIQFLPGLEGYAWVFPRQGHLAVGICGKGEPASGLRRRLDDFMAAKSLSLKDARFYSHLLPSLDAASWRGRRVAGEGWMAVGDAAGLVDPITGEGIYYALRSAELAAQALASGPPSPDGLPAHYRQLLRRDFMAGLEVGSRIARRFFLGRFLGGSVPARMVQLTRRSPRLAAVLQDLFSGQQPYLGLKQRLLDNAGGSLYDIGLSLGFNRPAQRRATARP